MSMKFTVHRDGYIDYDGTEIKPLDKEFISPLQPGLLCPGLNSRCYVIYQNWFGRWQIKEVYVTEICFSNIFSYHLSNGWWITASELGKTLFLYDELNTAKEICLHKNQLRKVKVLS